MADQERGTEIEKEQEMAQPETEEVHKEETAKTQSPEEDKIGRAHV